ncbi:MAG: 6-carboxytetrahydropterin synthase QueD [Deltaproteobacteria bacterium]|nr:6-carboxytetrahydropterin synthase QueD [Deltaproteobacteria bacterium]MCF8119306.1 6-carboxytetrahydropterin synthase QueD [Deltaproteobacteria bacterium]
MYELKIISDFAAAHQLREFEGGCERLHGHNWKVEVHVKGTTLGEDGLLVDFREIKAETQKVLDQLDHRFLNELPPFQELNPSSENIARHILEGLARKFDGRNVQVYKVSAWESESACASYTVDG